MFESKKNVADSNGGWLVEMRSDEDTILNQKKKKENPSRLHKLGKETHKNTTTTF